MVRISSYKPSQKDHHPKWMKRQVRMWQYEVQQPIRSKKQLSNMVSCFAGPVSLLTLWTNRITQANSRKHQEFAGRLSSVNNKAELYQHLKEENGCVDLIVCLTVYPVITLISHFVFNTHCVFFIRMDVHENGKATRWCVEHASSHLCRIIDLLRGCDVTFGMISIDVFARMLVLCQTKTSKAMFYKDTVFICFSLYKESEIFWNRIIKLVNGVSPCLYFVCVWM